MQLGSGALLHLGVHAHVLGDPPVEAGAEDMADDSVVLAMPEDRRAVTWAELRLVQTTLEKELAEMKAQLAAKASLSDVLHVQEVLTIKQDHMLKQLARIEWFIYGGVGVTLTAVAAALFALIMK